MRKRERALIHRFKAGPVDRRVIASTFVSSAVSALVIMGSATMIIFLAVTGLNRWWEWTLVGLDAAFFVYGSLSFIAIFTIPTSYVVTSQELIVKGLIGIVARYRLSIFKRIEDATGKFNPVSQRLRTRDRKRRGSGGAYGYHGAYVNDQWGPYQAYASNRESPIILLGESKLVISPEDPEDFRKIIGPLLEGKRD